MKQKIIVSSLCVSFLLGATVWAAPQAPKAAPLDQIHVSMDDGGHGGGHGGASESWTLRADDTGRHTQNFSTFDMVAGGARDIGDAIGFLPRGSYENFLSYLQWTRVLDLKLPAADDETGGNVYITVKRNGKEKSVRLPMAATRANAPIWTTLTLASSLTKDVKWKTTAQFKASTGIATLFQIDDTFSSDRVATAAAKAFPLPVFSVLDAAGKEVAEIRKKSDKERQKFVDQSPTLDNDWTNAKELGDFVVLPPGTYTLKFKRFDVPDSEAALATPTGFAWRPIYFQEEKVPVNLGKFSFLVIRLEKKPATAAAK